MVIVNGSSAPFLDGLIAPKIRDLSLIFFPWREREKRRRKKGDDKLGLFLFRFFGVGVYPGDRVELLWAYVRVGEGGRDN